ncbi:TIM21-domain-containing protein [Lipomyces chichibuensis]|uniref:TIM21-domain-containing protein n=1 Tax=Lipomyces chichibuensis TaxID=1546026 RepID=UPI0033436898
MTLRAAATFLTGDLLITASAKSLVLRGTSPTLVRKFILSAISQHSPSIPNVGINVLPIGSRCCHGSVTLTGTITSKGAQISGTGIPIPNAPVSMPVLRYTQKRMYATRKDTATSFESIETGAAEGTVAKVWNGTKRAFSFSFYTIFVASGFVAACYVIWSLIQTFVLPSGDVQVFNHTTEIVKRNPECQRLIGRRMSFHGESAGTNRWTRNRPVASSRVKDQFGNEHILMRFCVEGDLGEGIVQLDMTKKSGKEKFEYRYLHVHIGDTIVRVIDDPEKKPKQKGKVSFMGVTVF